MEGAKVGTKGSENQIESTVWDKINTESVSEFIDKSWRKQVQLARVEGNGENKGDFVNYYRPLPDIFPTQTSYISQECNLQKEA